MAPKNNAKGGDKKGAAKGKGKDAGEDAGGKGKGKGGLKAASSINVRHILVCSLLFSFSRCFIPDSNRKPSRRPNGI